MGRLTAACAPYVTDVTTGAVVFEAPLSGCGAVDYVLALRLCYRWVQRAEKPRRAYAVQDSYFAGAPAPTKQRS